MLIVPEQLEYKWYNERDVEVPLLLSTLKKRKPRLYLDVGSYYSWFTYGADVRPLLAEDSVYDGCDILPRPAEDEFIDHWFTCNVKDIGNVSYDFVSCISAIEHCGITTYKQEDVVKEQNEVFEKMLSVATKDLLITCPFGLPGRFEGQYQNITAEQYDLWYSLCEKSGFVPRVQFLYNEFPQGKKPWKSMSLPLAAEVPLDVTRGVQCMMAFHAHK